MTTAEIDRRPAPLSSALAILLIAAVAVACALVARISAPVGVLGFVLVAVGLDRGARRFVTGGIAALFVALLVVGWAGAPAGFLVLGATGAAVAWDLAQNAIGLGHQLGREAETTSAEITHAAGTTLVGAATAGVGYALFRSLSGGLPLTTLVLMLVAAVALASLLRS